MLDRRQFCIGASSAIVSSCAPGVSGRAGDARLIDRVTVLDGRGGPAVENARVIVRDGRILRVESAARGAIEHGETLDGRGKFLVPGFIDMHAHLLFPRCTPSGGAARFDRALSERALSRHLDFGVTTVRSPATPTIDGLVLRDDLNAARVRGPRAFASAELINDPNLNDAQIREIIRQALPQRPDYFKAYARLTPAQVATLIDEAHAHGVPVIGHLQRTSWAKGVALGIDHLAHSFDWSLESLPAAARAGYVEATRTRSGFRARLDWLEAFDPTGAEQQRLIDALAHKRVSVDVTLMAYDGKFTPPDNARYRDNPILSEFSELQQDWTQCAEATADWTKDDYRRWVAVRPKLFAWIKRMHDGSVLLVSGTDLTNEWIAPGVGLHQEFELLAEAGLSGDQILRMTGANAAEALRRDDVGIIAAGRRADLLLLNADPRQDIRNTRAIEWVMQGGTLVSSGPSLARRQSETPR